MSRPEPQKFDPQQLFALAQAVVASAKFPQLATVDGDQPRLRPVSPVRTQGFVVYVTNLRMCHKTAEIAANPKVELCYVSREHDQVRITDVAVVLDDRATPQSIWDENPLLRNYRGSFDNPALSV